jgi:tryptophanyl-tRNA synthetase
MGLLERAHAWKAAKDRGDVGAMVHGLFAYPVLMAADILIYDSDVVPVGKDQVQHVEMTRDMAERFNNLFGETFVLPRAVVQQSVGTIPGLDGQKMSKSYGNTITLMQSPKKLRKQIMQIVTDSTPLEDPKDPEGCNVFNLYKLFATPEQQSELAANYRAGGFGYGHAKQALFEVIDEQVAPARERYDAMTANTDELEDFLLAGAAKARAKAREVLDRARSAVGFRVVGTGS